MFYVRIVLKNLMKESNIYSYIGADEPNLKKLEIRSVVICSNYHLSTDTQKNLLSLPLLTVFFVIMAELCVYICS